MNFKKRLTRNISFKLLAEAISGMFGLILFVALARLLGDQAYGQYTFALSFAGLFSIFADCGMNTLLIREISYAKEKLADYIPSVTLIKCGLSLITWLAVIATISILGYPSSTIILVAWAGLMTVAIAWMDTIASFFNALEKIEREIQLKTLQRFLAASIGISVLWIHPTPLAALQIITVIYLGVAIWGFIQVIGQSSVSVQWNLDIHFIYALIRNSWPFWLAGFFVMIYFKVDTVMLSFFGRSHAEIGWYNVVVKLIGIINMFPHLIVLGIYPVMSDLHRSLNKTKHIFQKGMKYMFLLSLPFTLGICLLAKSIVMLLLGTAYLPAIPIMQILAWMMPFAFMNLLMFYTLSSIHKQRMVVIATGFGLFINIGLNLWLIPAMGYIAAGISTVITEGVVWIICLMACIKHVETDPHVSLYPNN